MTAPAEVIEALEWQQRSCRALGSPFYDGLLTGIMADVEAGGPCAAALGGPWAGNLIRLAVPLRFLGVLARLVLDGTDPALAAVWPPARPIADETTAARVRDAVEAYLPRFRAEMADVVQTNEVAR